MSRRGFIAAAVAKPGDVEITVTATMPLTAWREMYDKLDRSDHPACWNFRSALTKIIVNVQNQLSAEVTVGVADEENS